MAGVSTQFSIQDRMTSRLNTMIGAAQRLNRTLDATDALTDTIDPGAPFERSAADIGAASRQVDNFNNRQEQAERGANRVKSVWSKMGGVIKSALAAFSVKKIVELADGMTTTRRAAGPDERRPSNYGRTSRYDHEVRQQIPRGLLHHGRRCG